MLRAVVVALVVLWLVSVVLGHSFGGWVHVILLLAVVLLVVRVVGRRRR
jgi:hypothetical protein